jgi:CPA2 family monovalent cation:H+ antiporter-2
MLTFILAATGEAERVIAIDLFVILSVAGLVAIVTQRMRLAIVPAYLIAGAVIGPNALGFVPTEQNLEAVSHLAIVLLLFGIGLELDISILKHGLARMILTGVGSCVVSVGVGYPVALAFGLTTPEALAICMAFSLSSTAVVLRIITARRELRRRSGRLSFAILVVQDVVVLAMLALLPAIAKWAGGADAATNGDAQPMTLAIFTGDALKMIGGVAVLVVGAKTILPVLLRESLRGRRLEVMMLVGISAALAAAIVAQWIGFSLEMGAFLAGFVLAGTPFRHQLSGQIGPLRDIFSALFFTTVGMKVAPAIVMEHWWVILLGVAALVIIKTVVIGGICWTVGALPANAIIVGFSLAQAGEFSLILLGESGDLGIFRSPEIVIPTAIAIVVISLILTPPLIDVGRRLARNAGNLGHAPWIRSSLFGGKTPEAVTESGPRHIIIAGFGLVGRRIAEVLEKAGVSYTIIELNPDTVAEQLRRHRSIVFGDAANLQVLESAGLGHADALILTVPDEDAVLRACVIARRRSPAMFIAVRTGLISHSRAATDIGADHVTVDEVATAEAMARVVMDRLDLAEPEEIEISQAELATTDEPDAKRPPEPDLERRDQDLDKPDHDKPVQPSSQPD